MRLLHIYEGRRLQARIYSVFCSSLVQAKPIRMPMHCFMQDWSKCVDNMRDEGTDFTAECREAVRLVFLVLHR